MFVYSKLQIFIILVFSVYCRVPINNMEGPNDGRIHIRRTHSKICGHLIKCLCEGRHSHMLRWIKGTNNTEFEVDLTNMKSKVWNKKHASLFEELDKVAKKERQKEKNYYPILRTRFKSNMTKLCTHGYLKFLGEEQPSKPVKRRSYRILKKASRSKDNNGLKKQHAVNVIGIRKDKIVGNLTDEATLAVADPAKRNTLEMGNNAELNYMSLEKINVYQSLDCKHSEILGYMNSGVINSWQAVGFKNPEMINNGCQAQGFKNSEMINDWSAQGFKNPEMINNGCQAQGFKNSEMINDWSAQGFKNSEIYEWQAQELKNLEIYDLQAQELKNSEMNNEVKGNSISETGSISLDYIDDESNYPYLSDEDKVSFNEIDLDLDLVEEILYADPLIGEKPNIDGCSDGKVCENLVFEQHVSPFKDLEQCEDLFKEEFWSLSMNI